MKKISIKFVDFAPSMKIEEDMIYNSLKRLGYDIHISDAPDLLICSVFGYEYLKYNCKKIFFTGECRTPDFNTYDYALGFDYLQYGDRYLRAPLYFHPGYRKEYDLMQARVGIDSKAKEKFCSFTVSNGSGDPIRKQFFDLLSKYKKIDSGGRYANNLPDGKPVEDKLAFDEEHRFSIAFENTSYPGYTTEKIMQAFAAGCIPIYWGDPRIAQQFNPKAFINVLDFKTIEEAVDHVIEVDSDESLYRSMLKEPPVLPYQYSAENFDRDLDAFIANAVETSERRISDGCWNARYHKQLLKMNDLYAANQNNIIRRMAIKALSTVRKR